MRQWSMDLTGDSPGRQLAEPPLRSRRNINCPDDATSMRIKGGGSSSTIYTRPARSSTTTVEAYGSTQPHNNYNNNNNNFSNTRTMMIMAEDDELPRPVRLSRHIPQREGPADMDLSAYNLLVGSGGSGLVPSCTPTTTTTTTSAGANLSSVHGGFLRHTATPPPSLSASVSESMVSDDSAYMSSLYNDLLAEQLINRGADLSATRDGGVGVAVVGGGGAGGRPASPTATEMSAGRRLGGDVLRFGSPSHGGAAPTSGVGASLNIEASGILPASPSLGHLHTPQSPVLGSPFFLTSRTRRGGGGGGGVSGSGASGTSGAGVGLMSGGGGGGGTSSRLWMSANPERVLDAPNFPRRARQLLHWGSNNQIVIGLRNTLYTWSATTAQSGKLLELQDDASNNNNSGGGGGGTIRCLSWLHRCSCVAMGIDGSTVGIFDCRAESFLRTLRLPQDEEAVGLATNGPILAVATATTNNNSNNTSSGVGVARIFDLRQKNAHVALFSGFHDGQISSLHYSSAEPYYLATGGDDGGIGVWDLRQHHCPRYAMPNIHRGPVPALHWSNARRSRIYSGGADGVVCVLDTHAHPFPANTADADDAEDDDDVLLYDDERHGGVRGGGGGGSGASAAARAAHAAGFVVRAVNSHLPISGIVCQASNNVGVRGGGGGGEASLEHIVTAHRQQGQLQLRHGTSLVLHGISRATACDADLSCITAAPDGEQVCAAQDDETLKFWRMFPPSQDAQMGSGRSKYGRCLGSYASNNNNNNSGGGGTSSSSSRHPHRDPFFKLEEQLR